MTTARPTPPVGSGGFLLVPVVLAMLSMLGPFSIDTPFPAFQEMGRDLAVDAGEMQLVVTAYMVAFGVMSPFWGPLSDAVGRRPVIIGGVAVFVLATVGCALSTSLPVLLGFRVLQGLSAGGGVIVSRTIIRDVFEGAEAQRLMSRVMMIFAVAPAVAPVIGGWLLQVGPWSAIFWFLAGFGLLLIVLVLTVIPETHPAERRTPLAVRPLVGSLLEVSGRPALLRVVFASALTFGGQFLYIAAAPIFVIDLLGKGELDFWMLFVPMIGGVMTGAWLAGRAAGHISETRLVTWAFVFGGCAAILNVVLALLPTAADLPYVVIGPALIAVGTATGYPVLQLIVLDMFPQARGAAVSVFTFCTLILNGVSASLVVPHVTGSVLQLALASAVLIAVGGALWVWHLMVSRRSADVSPVTGRS